MTPFLLLQWLNQCIDQLNLQIDSFEAEIESLNTSKKKKNRSENADKIEDFNNLCEKHREHVSKLETLLRMLDNDAVNISQVRGPVRRTSFGRPLKHAENWFLFIAKETFKLQIVICLYIDEQKATHPRYIFKRDVFMMFLFYDLLTFSGYCSWSESLPWIRLNLSLQIKDIKDDVEYYIENCQEPDFCENDMMYDDIDGFEEMMLDLSNVSTGS